MAKKNESASVIFFKWKKLADYRNILRRISEGYYTIRNYDQMMENARKKRITTTFLIPPSWITSTHEGNTSYIHLKGDFYHYNFNYLSLLFTMYAYSPLMILDSITMLYALSHQGEACTNGWRDSSFNIRENAARIQQNIPNTEGKMRRERIKNSRQLLIKEDDRSTYADNMRKILEEDLTQDTGILKRHHSDKNDEYVLRVPLFNSISSANSQYLTELLLAIKFYTQVWLLSFPGNMLQKELESHLTVDTTPCFVFTHNNPARVLDEEVIYTLLQAMNNTQVCSVQSGKQKHWIFPQKIISNYRYNKQYIQNISTKNYKYKEKLKNEKKQEPEKIPLWGKYEHQMTPLSKLPLVVTERSTPRPRRSSISTNDSDGFSVYFTIKSASEKYRKAAQDLLAFVFKEQLISPYEDIENRWILHTDNPTVDIPQLYDLGLPIRLYNFSPSHISIRFMIRCDDSKKRQLLIALLRAELNHDLISSDSDNSTIYTISTKDPKNDLHKLYSSFAPYIHTRSISPIRSIIHLSLTCSQAKKEAVCKRLSDTFGSAFTPPESSDSNTCRLSVLDPLNILPLLYSFGADIYVEDLPQNHPKYSTEKGNLNHRISRTISSVIERYNKGPVKGDEFK